MRRIFACSLALACFAGGCGGAGGWDAGDPQPAAGAVPGDAAVLARRLGAAGQTLQLLYRHAGNERLLRVDLRAGRAAVALRVRTVRPRGAAKRGLRTACLTVRLPGPLNGRLPRDWRTGRPLPSLGEYGASRRLPGGVRSCDRAGARAAAELREVPVPRAGRISAKELPVAQGRLPFDLCPSRSELEDRGVRRDRVTARRQLRALTTAYARDRFAVVTSTTLLSGGGVSREDLTLWDLVATHLRALPELRQTGDAPARACARQLERQLSRLR